MHFSIIFITLLFTFLNPKYWVTSEVTEAVLGHLTGSLYFSTDHEKDVQESAEGQQGENMCHKNLDNESGADVF